MQNLRKVLPGDVIIFKLELISPIRRGLCHMHGKGFVEGKIVVEADLLNKSQKNNLYQPLSYVRNGLRVDKSVVIDPFVTIENNVIIGKGTWIGSNVTIMEGARIGENFKIFPGLLFLHNSTRFKI